MHLMIMRLRYMLYCCLHHSGYAHATWLKRYHVFAAMGEDCFFQPWFIPGDAGRVYFHNNVVVAANVSFICHDVIHHVFNKLEKNGSREGYLNYSAPIKVYDNVFIGSRSVILPGVKLGPNAIVAAGAIVNKDVPEDAIVGGNPARVIGSFEQLRKRRAKTYGNS